MFSLSRWVPSGSKYKKVWQVVIKTLQTKGLVYNLLIKFCDVIPRALIEPLNARVVHLAISVQYLQGKN